MKQKFNSKRKRFLVLAEKRTNNVLIALNRLTHCSNSVLYEYNQEELAKIFGAIEQALIETRRRFDDTPIKPFKLLKETR